MNKDQKKIKALEAEIKRLLEEAAYYSKRWREHNIQRSKGTLKKGDE